MFRFDYSDLYRSIGTGFMKGLFIKGLNRALRGKVEPISKDKVSFDLIKGCFVVEDLKPNAQFMSRILGIKVEKISVGQVIFISNWYNSNTSTEVEIDEVELVVDGKICVCPDGSGCFQCRKRPEIANNRTRVAAAAEYAVNKMAEILGSRIVTHVKRVNIVVRLEESILEVTMHRIKISKKEEEYKILVENEDISVGGVRIGKIELDARISAEATRCRVDIDPIEIEIERINTGEIERLIDGVRYLARAHNKQENGNGEEDKKTRATNITASVRVKVVGVEEIDRYSIKGDSIQIDIHEDSISMGLDACLDDNAQEIVRVEGVKLLLNTSDKQNSTERTNDEEKIEIKKVSGRITPELVETLCRVHSKIKIVANKFTALKKGKEHTTPLTIGIDQGHIETSTGNGTGRINIKRTEVTVEGKRVSFCTTASIHTNRTELSTGMEESVVEVDVSGRYSGKIEISALNILVLKGSVVNAVIMYYLLMREIGEFVKKHSTVKKEREEEKEKEKEIYSAPDREREGLSVSVAKCSISGVFARRTSSLCMSEASISGHLIAIDKIEMVCDGMLIMQTRILHLFINKSVEVAVKSSNINIENDDDFILSVLMEVRTLYVVACEVNRRSALLNTPDSTLQDTSSIQKEQKAQSEKSIKITLDKLQADVKGPKTHAIAYSADLHMELSEVFKIVSLSAELHNGSEVLRVSSHKLIFDFKESSLVGSYSVNGFVDVDLYVFLVNRAFFILECYSVMTELTIPGVPTVPGLSFLEFADSPPKEEKEAKAPIRIRIDVDGKIYLTKQSHTLCKTTSKIALVMTKGLLYQGTVSVVNPKVWADGLLIAHTPEIRVEFAKKSNIKKSFDIVVDRAEAQDRIGMFLDIFGLMTKVNFNNSLPTVGTEIDLKCKVQHIIVESEGANILLNNFVLINSYMQVEFMIEIENKKIFESMQKITIRTEAVEMPEMHISVEALESTLLEKKEIEGLIGLQKRLNQARIQRYSIPSNLFIGIKCPSVSIKTKHPPIKMEIEQFSVSITQCIGNPIVAMEGSALCKVFVKVRETEMYEIMCETFPIAMAVQTAMPLQKEKVKFCSLPFSESDEEPLLVMFLSFVVKDTIRFRISKKIVEAFKLSEKSIKLTNLTNKSIEVEGCAIEPMCSSYVRDDTFLIYTGNKISLFEKYIPNTKQAVQISHNIFLATFKETCAVIRGATNFKNITDTTLAIHIGDEKTFLESYTEWANTSTVMAFNVNIENDEESMCRVQFEVPSQTTSDPISIIGIRRIEHSGSYITVMCLFEIVSNVPILHYLFYHDFIINNLMLLPISFEIKISAKSKVEKIVGVAQSCEIKQISGNAQTEETKKIRLRINGNIDILLFPKDHTVKVPVSKGVVAVKEPKTVLISGFPVDIGITQITVFPVLIAINKTYDELYIRSGSNRCEIPYNQLTMLPTTKDKHSLLFQKVESKSFSSKIQYNTMFLDIKSVFQYNYLVNIYQGEGSKEKIKYVVVEYANVIENRTGLDLIIVTDREFSCGSGEMVPLHFPRKKISTWIKMGVLSEEKDPVLAPSASDVSDYILCLEESPDASYLPLDGLKKHFVKLNTTAEHSSVGGMTSSCVRRSSSSLISSDCNRSVSDHLSKERSSQSSTLEESPDRSRSALCVHNSILLSVHIQTQNSQRQIVIEKESQWPYLIKNMTQSEMAFSQKGYMLEYILQPGEILPYYWDSFKAEPAFSIAVDSTNILVENFAVTTAGEYKATLTSERNRKVLTVSKLTQEPRPDATATQGILLHTKTGRISLSLIDREEVEFSAFHLFNLHVISMFSDNGLEFMLKMDSVQMDNQEVKGYYHIPVHTPIPSDVISISGWIISQTTVRYLSIVILPVVLEIEEDYMKKVIQHFVPLSEPIENPKYFVMCSVCMNIRCKCTYSKPVTDVSGYISIGYLKIESIKFKCSFRRAARGSIVPLSSVFCNITSSKVTLPCIELYDVHSRTVGLCHLIGRTYKRGLIRNIVSLVLSADIVASPGELFDKLGVGVHDLIYAPYRAMDNPALLSKHLLIGGKSLAKNVVTGIAGFVGNVMGKVSQKLADISMDESFAEAIRETSCIYVDELDLGLPVSKTHLSKAGEKFMGSVISGFKGVVHSPMQGRKSNGISGMVQGIGKGIVGAIVKPFSGAIGLVQGISTSITGVLDSNRPLLRVQLPRAPPLDGIPCEYEVERNAYYRAYVVLARDGKKNEVFITGGICTKKYIGWYIIITNIRVIFYNKEEVQVIPGVSVAQEHDKNTLISIGTVDIYLEGVRVFKDLEKYNEEMVTQGDNTQEHKII